MIASRPVKITIPEPGVLEQRRRREDERAALASAAAVTYRPQDAAIELRMRSGIIVRIPLRSIAELADAPADILKRDLTLASGGEAISVRALDVDIAVSGLLRDLLGLNFQRLGGLAKTAAKAAAARANGAKGGRPRKLTGR